MAYEDYLIELWKKQLNLARIGIHDDFFAAGGSSMQVIEMLMAVAERFGVEIDFDAFFREPSIRRLSELLAV
jgi:acyl carrier protein